MNKFQVPSPFVGMKFKVVSNSYSYIITDVNDSHISADSISSTGFMKITIKEYNDNFYLGRMVLIPSIGLELKIQDGSSIYTWVVIDASLENSNYFIAECVDNDVSTGFTSKDIWFSSWAQSFIYAGHKADKNSSDTFDVVTSAPEINSIQCVEPDKMQQSQILIYKVVEYMSNGKKRVIYTTHDPHEANEFSKKQIYYYGKKVVVEPPS